MVVIEPEVHRDARGFFVETFRAERLAELGHRRGLGAGQPLALGPRGRCAGCTSRSAPARPSWCAARAGRSSTWRSTSAAARPPSAAGTRCASTTSACRAVYLPVGFAHGFVVVSEVADVVYKCSSYYDPELERGFAWDDPDVGIRWPELDVEVSERDAAAPRLREIAHEIPFAYYGRALQDEPRRGAGRRRRRRPRSSARRARAAARRPARARRPSSAIRAPRASASAAAPPASGKIAAASPTVSTFGRVVAHQQRGAGRPCPPRSPGGCRRPRWART